MIEKRRKVVSVVMASVLLLLLVALGFALFGLEAFNGGSFHYRIF